jgi:Zn-dependent peptidase ImmA (M78 family)/transcriptional regulator with XRE-family HTH domain
MQIGQRIKIAREAIGYTLERASSESGIGLSSLSEFENNKREPKFSHLSKLSDVYKKSIEFFLTDSLLAEPIMLWRDAPENSVDMKKTEAEFYQLCQQYHRLEVLCGEVGYSGLPVSRVKREEFDYKHAGGLATEFQKEYILGEIPSASLKQILEERFCVKIFHLVFSGSAISTVSSEFGPAILLNANSKLWRRNYDLAHELFHLLTWSVFRTGDAQDNKPGSDEEKLANAFASRLLLPTDAVKDKIDAALNQRAQVSFDDLDEIAREFGVSMEALLWRIMYIYNKTPEEVEKYIEQARKIRLLRPLRKSDIPDRLPERYCSLAIRALRAGKLSLMQFKKFIGITYKEAEEYLVDDEDFTDEKISISIA